MKHRCYTKIDDLVEENKRLKDGLEKKRHYLEIEVNEVYALKEKLRIAKEALEVSVGWMEPIMDGFGVPDKQIDGSPSARVAVLNKAKEALQRLNETKEKS